MDTRNVKEVLINSRVVVEMWLNNTQVYNGALWYGVKFTGSSATGTRTGNTYMHKNLPIQSQMKGCTVTTDGVVKYLNPTDWTKYEDGTARDASLNTMVEIPEHYRLFIAETSENVEVRISPYALPGYIQVKKQYVSAYEAYSDNSVLKSIKGYVPTVSIDRATMQTRARANGNEHWNMYTYEIHKALTWLFVVEYATRDSQKTVNAALTADGYRQGGLGPGCTTGTYDGTYAFMPAGTSDSLGNGSGEVTHTASTRKCNRYRGVENPFGHIWKNVIDVIVTGTNNQVYLCQDFTKFGNDKSTYTLQNYTNHTSDGWLKTLVNNSAGDLFCSAIGGSGTTDYCDYMWTNPLASDRTLLLGASSGHGGVAGWFCLASNDGLGGAASTVGTRITYIP